MQTQKNLDRPNADLAPRDYFVLEGWCRAKEWVRPAHSGATIVMGGIPFTPCEANDEGAIKNLFGMSALFEVLSVDYPSVIVKMHEMKPDHFAGRGYSMVLDCRDFNCRRPTGEYVREFLQASAAMHPTRVQARDSLLRRLWRKVAG
jgi:hypothetical protein